MIDGGDLSIIELVTDDDAVPAPGGDLRVGGVTTLTGGITGGLDVNDGGLEVTGDSTFTGDVLVVGNNDGTPALTVSGPSELTGATKLTGGVDGRLKVNSGGLEVMGDSLFTGDVEIVGNEDGTPALDVTGITELNGFVDVNGGAGTENMNVEGTVSAEMFIQTAPTPPPTPVP